MPVIARDAVASDHLVYAWPFPIGPEEYDVSCLEDELVVMCPAWLVGDRLGPGRHRWRTPDPTRPVSAYFVLTAPVEVSFDMITQFMLPATGQAMRLRAVGSLQVRCMDPALLVAQFVGLPFDAVNDGVLRSVSRSIERMLARLLTRRVVMAGTPQAVIDPSMRANIIEELVAYNPTAGAVFGVELMRFGHLSIAADDGTRPWQQMLMPNGDPSRQDTNRMHTPVPGSLPRAETVPLPENESGALAPDIQPTTPSPPSRALSATLPPPLPPPVRRPDGPPQSVASGEIVSKPRPGASSSSSTGVSASGEIVPKARDSSPAIEASGEIVAKGTQPKTTALGVAAMPAPDASEASGPKAIGSSPGTPATPPPIPSMAPLPSKPAAAAVPAPPSVAKPARRAGAVEVQNTDEPTHPGIDVIGKPLPGAPPAPAVPAASAAAATPPPAEPPPESRGSILGIGMAHIGSSEVASGEITKKIAPGGRVLVPGPNGLMQSATVRQLLQGYYELEVGGSGETIWVPVSGVVPE